MGKKCRIIIIIILMVFIKFELYALIYDTSLGFSGDTREALLPANTIRVDCPLSDRMNR